MRIDIITIFPEMFTPILNESIIKRAQVKKKVKIYVHDLRNYTLDKHKKVDDRPFGGGSGMVMSCQPIFAAVEEIKSTIKKSILRLRSGLMVSGPSTRFTRSGSSRAESRDEVEPSKIILLCPQGKKLNQETAKKLARLKHLIMICGHYEGVDERVRQYLVDEEISIGDYVVTGGELPAMVLLDCVVRLIPGVLGDKKSLNFESFEGNLLEYPQYTRPAKFRDMCVPQILLSGDHKKIEIWRKKEAIKRTRQRRPDLLKLYYKEGIK